MSERPSKEYTVDRAAPEMYAALKRARQGYANMLEFRILRDEDKREAARDILAQCDAALAKAEGRS